MSDSDEGWQPVLPTSHHGMDRLSHAQSEIFERQILKEWESSSGKWSGIGKHTPHNDFVEAKKIAQRFRVHGTLGYGAYGLVERVGYLHNNRSVYLARKHLRPGSRRITVQMLRGESNVMENLSHDHIIKLVGTYCVNPYELFILTWPVAICNLENLLNDIDGLRTGEGDREDIIAKLDILGLKDTRAVERRNTEHEAPAKGHCPLQFLRQIIGCLANAIGFCHKRNIRHLDLKPSNILINPGKVLLTDFGIARDVSGLEHTMTAGMKGTRKWIGPEVREYRDARDEWSMMAADIYGLGLIFTNIATFLYDGVAADFDPIKDEDPKTRPQKLKNFLPELARRALATQEVEDVKAPTFGPKHLVGLLSKMLSDAPMDRPQATQVNEELVAIGGIDQIYHHSCCKKSSRFVTELMNRRLKEAMGDREKMVAEQEKTAKALEILQNKAVLLNERVKTEHDGRVKLFNELQKERAERERLEKMVAEMRRGRRIPHPRDDPRSENGRIPRGPVARGINGNSPQPASTTQVIRLEPQSPSVRNAPTGPRLLSQPTPVSSAFVTQISYSQTAATGLPKPTPQTPAARRSDPVNRNSSGSPAVLAAVTMINTAHSPSPSPVGNFALRSRNSGSRLPVLTSTPRSCTPKFSRDTSLTSSTQFSMNSSTFSLQSRRSQDSESVAGTPAMEASPFNAKEGNKDVDGGKDAAEDANYGDPAATVVGVGLGLGLGMSARRESAASERDGNGSVRFAGSVVGSEAEAAGSSALSPSALSSPRVAMAELESVGSNSRGRYTAARIPPPLPTAKSWADVAKRR